MPRIAEGRAAALPNSAEQKDRHLRILHAASALGAEHGLERVQMHDVAKAAEVAIGTLYRYFPSKTHLFTAVMKRQLGQLIERTPPLEPGEDPVAALVRMLVRSSRDLMLRPKLAEAMLQSNNAAHANAVADAEHIDRAFQGLLLRTLGISRPSQTDRRMIRLVEQCWYGVLSSVIDNRISMSEAEADIEMACELLTVVRSNAQRGS